jgi:hypothetical protein
MPQHDYAIADASGAAFLADLNNALSAVATGNSGSAAPSVTYPYMPWADTGSRLWKVRNSSNSDWVTIGPLDTPAWGLAPLAGATFTGPVSLPSGSTVAGYLAASSAGVRNVLINGNPVIKQREYASGAATTAANQYTLDRWRVVTSGQSISWADSGNIRTVTAPAGGVEQVIEGASITTGTYTLNWIGTATATVAGAAVTRGSNMILTGGANTPVRFSGGTFSLAQLEPGSFATAFELRPQELALCQRYFEWAQFTVYGQAPGGGSNIGQNISFATTKRIVPTMGALVADSAQSQTQTNISNAFIQNPSLNGYLATVAPASAGLTYLIGYRVAADAEIY